MNPVVLKLRNLAALGLTATSLALAQTSINATNYVTVAATGALIPDPTLGLKTTAVTSAGPVTFPEGMVFIPADESNATSAGETAGVSAFAINLFEVTNAEWLEFVDETGRTPPVHWRNGIPPIGKMNHPVVMVSWHDAMAYCAWLSQKTGCDISLPTEAQWAKAVRGPRGYNYPWGPASGVTNVEGRLTVRFNHQAVCATQVLATQPTLNYTAVNRITTNPTTHALLGADRAVPTADVLQISAKGEVSNWKNGNGDADFSSSDEAQALLATGGYTQAIGSYAGGVSAYGCYDLAGNVAEWTRAPGTSGGTQAVLGGSWASTAAACSSGASPEYLSASAASAAIGFRVVCNFPVTR